jgi:hypothetical protein
MGLSPVGSRQLRLAHRVVTKLERHRCWRFQPGVDFFGLGQDDRHCFGVICADQGIWLGRQEGKQVAGVALRYVNAGSQYDGLPWAVMMRLACSTFPTLGADGERSALIERLSSDGAGKLVWPRALP